MPANLTPEYLKAEQKYRLARTPLEKIETLKEMLSVIPKHKGTDHLQGDIKAKIAKFKRELETKRTISKKKGLYIEKEGAGQIVLLGSPNVGKSSLLAKLTNANPQIAEYPFSTSKPITGMMDYEDIKIQLVDTPPITDSRSPPWLIDLSLSANLILALLDLSKDNIIEDAKFISNKLDELRIEVNKIIIGCNKSDIDRKQLTVDSLQLTVNNRVPVIRFSTKNGHNLNKLRKEIFRRLEIIRVYTKSPGKEPEMTEPIVLKKGSTVIDAARDIHKDFAENLKFVRIWGSEHNGQRVERSYVLQDRDIIEFHLR